MLLLSRRRGESLLIGDTVEVTVLSIEGDKVRLGIKAPAAVAVYRRELYESIRQENQRAARAGVDALARALDVKPPTPGSPPARPRRKP